MFPSGNMTTHELAAEIKRVRKQLNVTQEQLALTAGTGLRFVIDLEKGKPTCQIGKALAVLETLGIRLTLQATGLPSEE
jgi:HTH-type transcriptional regulator / antitoxin HipB